MAKPTLFVYFDKEGAASLNLKDRRDSYPRFPKALLNNLLTGLKNKSTVQSVSAHLSKSIKVTPRRGAGNRFKDDVLAVAREYYHDVDGLDYDRQSEVVGTRRRAHIVYITDPRVTVAVIVFPGEVDGNEYVRLIEKFSIFGKVEVCKNPFRANIYVSKIAG